MASGLRISATSLAALETYVQGVATAAHEAADVAYTSIEHQTQQRARASAAWRPLADHIQVHRRDGAMVVGVAPDFVSEAMTAEYGTPDTAPTPLFRTMGPVARLASEDARNFLSSRYGPR